VTQAPLPSRILIPVANPLTAEDLVRIGAALLERKSGSLTILGIVEVPEGVPLSEGATRARQARRLLQRVLDFAPEGVTVHTLVRVGRRAAEGVVESATELESDLVVFGWGGKTPVARPGEPAAVFSPTIDEVVRDAPCDIAVVKQAAAEPMKRILVPVRGGPHAELALRLAGALAHRTDGRVVALHVVPPGLTDIVRTQAERALSRFVREHAGAAVESSVVEAANVRNAILREVEGADAVVMGAAATSGADGSETYLFGALPEAIATRCAKTVIVVKTREAISEATFQRLEQWPESLAAAERAASEQRAIPARVERWFGESNFHHREFRDLDRLVLLKEKAGLTVSLVLPALNEAETIGPIVRRAREELMEQRPLIDELLVMDSDSSDATREIAAAEGARVAIHQQVLTRHGSYAGKGEALWKSLYETSGDIVAWADTDVRGWHSRMVYGIIGPLLAEERLQYVKGYYRRPIVEGGALKEGGGGRVTELVARPLINLFYPELSGMIQPLSGEYAGRRSLLETIPFFSGYAVEIGHLIDVVDRVGLEGLGQVDLERRVHRNQTLEGLSRMSFVIHQAVMRKLEQRHRARLLAELGTTMQLPRYGGGKLGLEVIELADHERPPMIQIPEYLERRREAGGVGSGAGVAAGGAGVAAGGAPGGTERP
jgi:nucleotide-binding universal stress UspA family protein